MSDDNEEVKPGDKVPFTCKDGTEGSCELYSLEKDGSYWVAEVICPDGMTNSTGRSSNK